MEDALCACQSREKTLVVADAMDIIGDSAGVV
jgi:hypothetical protein